MTKTALEQQLVQAKSAFQVGSVTIADVNDDQAGFDAASAQEIQDENNNIFSIHIFIFYRRICTNQTIQMNDLLFLQNPAYFSKLFLLFFQNHY